jgi:hypothetical protein
MWSPQYERPFKDYGLIQYKYTYNAQQHNYKNCIYHEIKTATI